MMMLLLKRTPVPTVCFCVLLIGCTSVFAENVLISCSVGEGSHYFVGKTIGKYLAKHGHNVTVLLSNAYAYRAENPDDRELNFIIFNHSVPPEAVRERHKGYSKIALEPLGARFFYNLTMSQRQGNVDDCEDLLVRNPDVMHRLEHGNFSAVVYDQIWTCSLFLAMKLDTMAIMSNPMAALDLAGSQVGNPTNLALMPTGMTGFRPDMSFFQRVVNVLAHEAIKIILTFFISPFDELRQRLAIRPDLPGTAMELIATYPSLFLFNFEFGIEYPAAVYPNIIPIGGITAKPAGALPEELEDFMESSGEHGVILFTLGTYAHQIRVGWLQPFAEALGKFPQKVLWQMSTTPPFKLPSNVKTLPWLPQNDILGHPKTRLFISQGGNNGFYESQFHGVPVIIIPLGGDAVDAATRAVHRGFGLTVDKSEVTTERLHTAIHTILNNDSFAQVAKRNSEILRSRDMHPGDRAAFWVTHVMRHGGEYMRNPSLELSFVQRHLIDVAAFLLAVIASVVVVAFFLCRCCCRCCKRICFRPKQKSD
ncbi:UDP-glucuronosyltransferase 1-2-like [Diadema antillarum]|uniref:UDP-glucuronosyltransferase 1-2-like n=1 Tax=Diadema antillarum TaxID=105358 RepID=UPI003A852C66